VTVHQVEVLDWSPPLLTFRALVGTGTYLRALARDLGEHLGIGAHLVELRRERIGPWQVEQAHPLDDLTGAETLLPPEGLLDELGRIPVTADEARLIRHGRDIERTEPENGPEAGLYEGDRLVAVAQRVSHGWHPSVVLPESVEAGR
jgi:tRNA pseudouridine55 synthase